MVMSPALPRHVLRLYDANHVLFAHVLQRRVREVLWQLWRWQCIRHITPDDVVLCFLGGEYHRKDCGAEDRSDD